jgi:hypothetical protein
VAASQTHTAGKIWHFFEILVVFEFRKCLEQPALPEWLDADSSIYNLSFQHLVSFIIRWVATQSYQDVSVSIVVLDGILHNVKQHELVHLPIKFEVRVPSVLPCDVDAYVLAFYGWSERHQKLVDYLLRALGNIRVDHDQAFLNFELRQNTQVVELKQLS